MNHSVEISFSKPADSSRCSVCLNGTVRDLYAGLAHIFADMHERDILDDLTLMAIWVASLSLPAPD